MSDDPTTSMDVEGAGMCIMSCDFVVYYCFSDGVIHPTSTIGIGGQPPIAGSGSGKRYLVL